MRGKRRKITEQTATPFAGSRVDRAAGCIRDVLICGFESANGRTYPAAVLRESAAKYEGRPVNADHGREATISRRMGWFSDVRAGADGRPRGTLHLLENHPMTAAVFEAAERNPALYGLSHVAYCQTSTKNGREVVESIDRVESIDLVAEPATTKSLFESRAMPSLKQFVESLVRHPKVTSAQIVPLKRLAEMDGMDAMDAPPLDVPAEDADPMEGVSAAFKAAISAIVEAAMGGSLDPKEALSKIKKLMASHGEVKGGPAVGTESEDDTEEFVPESKQAPAVDPWTLLRECRAENGPDFAPSETQLKALSLLTDPADRKQLLAEMRAVKAAPVQRPVSGAPRARVEEAKGPPVPTDAQGFAEYVR